MRPFTRKPGFGIFLGPSGGKSMYIFAGLQILAFLVAPAPFPRPGPQKALPSPFPRPGPPKAPPVPFPRPGPPKGSQRDFEGKPPAFAF